MVTSIWCHLRRHQKRKTMGPYASSPTFQPSLSAQSSPVKYSKVSGRVCLPFHETLTTLNTLHCPSVGCGGEKGGGGGSGVGGCGCGGRGGGGGGEPVMTREAESMDVDKERGGEGEARPPSPPPVSSRFERHHHWRCQDKDGDRHSPQIRQPSLNGHDSPFYGDAHGHGHGSPFYGVTPRSRENLNGNDLTRQTPPPPSPQQYNHNQQHQKPQRQQLAPLTSSSSSPHMSSTTSDLTKNPQRCKENVSSSSSKPPPPPPLLTLTHNSPDLSNSVISSPHHPDYKKVHSPSFFPHKFTLPPCDALVSPSSSPLALSPNPSLQTMCCASSSVPSIPSKLSRPPSRDPLFSAASASSSAINIPGMSAGAATCASPHLSSAEKSSRLTHVCSTSSISPFAAPNCASAASSPAATAAATSASSPNILSKSLPSPVANFLLLKSKPRGLLERRGSNQSLTLNISSENFELDSSAFSPSYKSDVFNVEEFLVTTTRRLTRKELRKAVKNSKRVSEEFWSIPMNLPDRVEVSGSSTKNRYQSIIPNAKTRVHLQLTTSPLPPPPPSLPSQLAPPPLYSTTSSTSATATAASTAEENVEASTDNYINANYVEGQGGENKAYIATQGPMEHTISDFWRMVWKERSPIIVMITKLKERNKSKCELYLPVLSASRYGDLTVRVEKIEQREGFQLRTLTVAPAEDSDGNSMERDARPLKCFHCWFTSWPDHKAPQNPKPLLDMIYFVEENRRDQKTKIPYGPVVVHCSAGIGRTGCFIAISLGMQQLMKENCVDILRIVCRLRKDRGGMIQTSEQYEFIYLAIAAFEKSMQSSPPLNSLSNGGEDPSEFNSFLSRIQSTNNANAHFSSPKSAPLPPY